jgi:hypothetical protein
MAETNVLTDRPDIDIEADIRDLIIHYPPAAHDRNRFDVSVNAGNVTLKGYVQSPVTHHYLLENVPSVAGVTAVSADEFCDDETIRIEVGQLVPPGVQVNIDYGRVILTGKLPPGMKEIDVVRQLASVHGIWKIITAFKS